MTTPSTPTRRQGGFGLLEIIIVITIMGLGAMMVMKRGAGQEARMTSKEYTEAMRELFINGREWSAMQADTSSAKNSTLLGFAPRSMIAGEHVRNTYGGLVTLAPATVTLTNDAIAFTSQGIPHESCRRETGKLQDITAVIAVNGQEVKAAANDRITDDTLGTACIAGNGNEITYTLRRM